MWAGDARVARVARVVSDLTGGELSETRILDLACDEGNFAIELAAMAAAEVVGIEGRDKLASANAKRESRGLSNVRFERGDVREVTAQTHGIFDVVLIAAKGRAHPFDPPQAARWPERLPQAAHPTQGLRWRLVERISRARGGGLSTFFQRPGS